MARDASAASLGTPSAKVNRILGAVAGATLALLALALGPLAAGAAACSNEAIRAEQHAEMLLECRAWEMVSPLDKNGANITSEAVNVVSSADGEAVSFMSRGGFADVKSFANFGLTQYVARRGAADWTTNGISPVANPEAPLALFSRDQADLFSSDLRKAVVFGYDLPEKTDDIPGEMNIYHEDTVTGELQTVSRITQLTGSPAFLGYSFTAPVAASDDVETIAFNSSSQLLPEATPGVQNVYEWDHGALRLAGILPDGTVPSEGSSLQETAEHFRFYPKSVSADGSRLAFLAPKEGQNQLYLRRNHTTTVWVSESEASTPVSAPEEVRLQWMSPDGRKVLFTTTSQLLDGDTNGAPDLYLYTDGPNPSAESNLTLISDFEGVNGQRPSAVVGATDDASRIYYMGQGGLLYWDDGETKLVKSGFYRSPTYPTQTGYGLMDYPGGARVSADGLHVAFIEAGEDPFAPAAGQQMYVYNALTETLTCASCMAEGPTEVGVPDWPRGVSGLSEVNVVYQRPQWMSSDGHWVYFTTAAPLVEEDINGVEDVYAYDTETGERHLISSGRGEHGAWFEDQSASGRDVFFVTASQLVGRDTDTLFDLYDARAEGGFAEVQPPSPCVGDGCRGALSKAPTVNGAATSAFSGPGNVKQKVRKHRRHHRKHHKKHHQHHHNQQGAGK